MIMSFFRQSPDGLDHIEAESVKMLTDARHSFDLATTALLAGSAPETIGSDIRSTDQRINQAEQDLRAELVIHATVQGTGDIASVLGLLLLLKKIERIGDQAKNILDLAEAGVRLSDGENNDELSAEQAEVSALFDAASKLLTDPTEVESEVFVTRISELMEEFQTRIDSYIKSPRPGYEVVPLAIYYRYLKRIVANLRGVVGIAIDPLPHIDYLDQGQTDTDD